MSAIPLGTSEPASLTLPSIGDSDDFITELWKVHLRVKKEGYVQVGTLTAYT